MKRIQTAHRMKNENDDVTYTIIERRSNKMLDANIKELIAIGASVSANCHPCMKYHTAKARELKIDEAEIQQAIDVGKMVRKGATGEMDKLLEELL